MKTLLYLKCTVMVWIMSYLQVLGLPDMGKQHSNTRNCISEVMGQFINYSSLYKPEGYNVSNGKDIFHLNICGTAPSCGANITACQIDKSGYKIDFTNSLNGIFSGKACKGQFGKLHLIYKNIQNKIDMIICLQCDRYINQNDLSFIQSTKRTLKFLMKTSAVCYETPMDCKNYKDKWSPYTYDLTSLKKSSSSWSIDTIHKEKLYINICESYPSTYQDSTTEECSIIDTHVCLRGNNKVINFGTQPVWNTKDDFLLSFIDGSPCGNGKYRQTNVEFLCSFEEQGPRNISQGDNCTYHIVWYTPAACPHQISNGKNCVIDTWFSNSKYDMNKTKKLAQDMTRPIKKKMKVKYNVCGPLESVCDKQTNVSICLINDSQEIVYGYYKEPLIIRDLNIYKNLTGTTCRAGINNSVDIIFQCSYTSRPEEIDFNERDCHMNIIIYTRSACPISEPQQLYCEVKVDGKFYDLQPLADKYPNYAINDPYNNDIFFIINICTPIIPTSGSWKCYPDSICKVNRTEPDFRKRFTGIGLYNSLTANASQNGSIKFTYKSNAPCLEPDDSHYVSEIEFKCGVDKIPVLLTNEPCLYKFLWETSYVCPTKYTTQQAQSDIGVTDKTEVEKFTHEFINPPPIIRHEEVISDILNSKQADRSLDNKNKESKGMAEKQNEVKYERKSQTEPFERARQTYRFAVNFSMLFIPPTLINDNCTLIDRKSNTHLNLQKLQRNITVTSSGKIYLVKLCFTNAPDKCMQCDNYSNHDITLSKIHLNSEKHFIQMNTLDNITCADRMLNPALRITCSPNLIDNWTILEKDQCDFVLEWKNKALCTLFDNSGLEEHVSTGMITVSVMVPCLVIIIVTVIIWYMFCKKTIPICPNECHMPARYSAVHYEKDTSL